MRILLVDPDGASRSEIARWVEESFAHVEIVAASSGAEALLRLEQFRPDLVLAAYPVPALNGVELAAVLKARTDAPLLVVIAGSGVDLQGRAVKADLFIEKRHLQTHLLTFLQLRFPSAWASGVAARSSARPMFGTARR